MITARLGHWLDRRLFLGYRLWEFSLRNTPRWFFWHYLFRVLLQHPVAAIRGLLEYRRYVRQSRGRPLHGTMTLEMLAQSPKHTDNPFVIAPGFCMKPYGESGSQLACPAGRFNHDCRMFERSAELSVPQKEWPQPCSDCRIGTLAQLASQLHADFYIMTSALDIARDLFLPALEREGARQGVFVLCAYSCEAFTFGLLVSGIKGALVTFCDGDCLNHQDFTEADKGVKPKQTFVEPDTLDSVMTTISEWNPSPIAIGDADAEYVQNGNVYQSRNVSR